MTEFEQVKDAINLLCCNKSVSLDDAVQLQTLLRQVCQDNIDALEDDIRHRDSQ